MTVITGELWQHGNGTVLFLSCTNCGKYLDEIRSEEVSEYIRYVQRTGDVAFCQECDTSQDDIIHPYIEAYCKEVLGDAACLVTHNFTNE